MSKWNEEEKEEILNALEELSNEKEKLSNKLSEFRFPRLVLIVAIVFFILTLPFKKNKNKK